MFKNNINAAGEGGLRRATQQVFVDTVKVFKQKRLNTLKKVQGHLLSLSLHCISNRWSQISSYNEGAKGGDVSGDRHEITMLSDAFIFFLVA